MKRTSFFAKALMGAAVVTMSMGIVSCNDKKQEDPAEAAEEQNEQKFDDTASDHLEDDSEYVLMAAEVDMKEIELGKLAQQKGMDAEVKSFGKMMVDQHTQSSATTKALAQSKNISLPMATTDKVKEAMEDLNKKTGKDFDEAYIDMMVDGHEKTIQKMEKASENAKDADIRMWAANMLPTLRTHLDHAKKLDEKTDAKK
jgi:putative membrane protein